MHFLCKTSDLPLEGSKAFNLKGTAIFVVAKENNHYAYVNECPHLGVDLNWAPDKFLDINNQHIQCSMHGALFSITEGECLHGPCLGDFLKSVTLHFDGDTVKASLP